jgi:hypothetical protein
MTRINTNKGFIFMQANRAFNTMDTFSVFASIILFVFIVTAMVSKSLSQNAEHYAVRDGEKIGLSLLSKNETEVDEQLKSKSTEVRAPASTEASLFPRVLREGRSGQDPWGQPFSYTLLKDHVGQTIAIVVSAGPNRISEVSGHEILMDDAGGFQTVIQKGDDVVILKRMVAGASGI